MYGAADAGLYAAADVSLYEDVSLYTGVSIFADTSLYADISCAEVSVVLILPVGTDGVYALFVGSGNADDDVGSGNADALSPQPKPTESEIPSFALPISPASESYSASLFSRTFLYSFKSVGCVVFL